MAFVGQCWDTVGVSFWGVQMNIKICGLILFFLTCTASIRSEQILVGVERKIPAKNALLFTPVVLPDLISFKMAYERTLGRKFNLVVPLEAKWMDYHHAIKWGAKLFGAGSDYPESLYTSGGLRPGFNIDMLHFKISTGVGVKWLPFSESMTNAFFIKTLAMVGLERMKSYTPLAKNDGAVFTHVATLGYNWVKPSGFTFGFEVGEEYTWHVNPMKKMPPILVSGFLPIVQFSLGFTK